MHKKLRQELNCQMNERKIHARLCLLAKVKYNVGNNAIDNDATNNMHINQHIAWSCWWASPGGAHACLMMHGIRGSRTKLRHQRSMFTEGLLRIFKWPISTECFYFIVCLYLPTMANLITWTPQARRLRMIKINCNFWCWSARERRQGAREKDDECWMLHAVVYSLDW